MNADFVLVIIIAFAVGLLTGATLMVKALEMDLRQRPQAPKEGDE